MEDGYTKEEWKMMVETKKILDPKIKLTATCVRVPVFIGHSEVVNIEFENPISVDEARSILRSAPGCLVIDKHEPGGYVTPYECVGEDATYISRIRTDPTVDNGLVLWVVSDNLRKGAALNAIQIAECLINRKLIEAKRRRRKFAEQILKFRRCHGLRHLSPLAGRGRRAQARRVRGSLSELRRLGPQADIAASQAGCLRLFSSPGLDLATSRAQSMNNCAAGLSARSFNVSIPMGPVTLGSSTGNFLMSGCLSGKPNTDLAWMAR